MKKIFTILMFLCLVFLTGCGSKSATSILKDMEKKLNSANSYYLEGTMEIMNHEDSYKYDVTVSYQKKDYYKIDLVNTLNHHEQVILRNDDGVYVVTPSLNKSFKFQSDWPYNNSQVYLLHSIIDDLKDDKKMSFSEKENGYLFTSSVYYPNNQSLVSQNVYVDKDGNITRTEVLDKDGNVQIAMSFSKIEMNKKFEDNYFELNRLLKKNQQSIEEEKVEDNNESDKKEEESSNQNQETKSTMKDYDIVYPMYLPDNTYLTSQERVDTKTGERLILTFGGDSSFVLVEEVSHIADDNVIVPVNGDFDFFTDVIGIISGNSLSWHSNGIDYYMVSDVIETSELIDIARSISVLPVSK